MDTIHKYPRTPHMEGSRLQPGDADAGQVSLRELDGCHVVIEEKVDGSNSGISFAGDGTLLLQSRGHFMRGGPRERQFDLLKSWARAHETALREILGTRYVMYGEWAFAKHTIFYDALPHYFLEFDMLDRETGRFLSTRARRTLLAGSPVCSVSVLHEGAVSGQGALRDMVGTSRHKSPDWRSALATAAAEGGVDLERAWRETDESAEMEGLYLKIETEEETVGRAKFIRPSFLTTVIESETHWIDRPIIRNGLAGGVDIFAG